LGAKYVQHLEKATVKFVQPYISSVENLSDGKWQLSGVSAPAFTTQDGAGQTSRQDAYAAYKTLLNLKDRYADTPSLWTTAVWD